MVEPFELQSRFVRAMQSRKGAKLSFEELQFLIERTAMLDDLSQMVIGQLKEIAPCQELPKPKPVKPKAKGTRSTAGAITGSAPEAPHPIITSSDTMRKGDAPGIGQRALMM